MTFRRSNFIVGLIVLITGALLTFGMLFPALTGKVGLNSARALEVFSFIPISISCFGLFMIAVSFGFGGNNSITPQ